MHKFIYFLFIIKSCTQYNTHRMDRATTYIKNYNVSKSFDSCLLKTRFSHLVDFCSKRRTVSCKPVSLYSVSISVPASDPD